MGSPTGKAVAELSASDNDPDHNSDSMFTVSMKDPVNLAAAVDFACELRSTDADFDSDPAIDGREAAAVLSIEEVTTEAATALAALSTLVVSSTSRLFKVRLGSSTALVSVARPAAVSEKDSPERR